MACLFSLPSEVYYRIEEWGSENLLIPKLLYFTLNVLCYCVYTYTGIYFEQVWKISNYHYGYIIGICCGVSFGGSLLWTILADRTGHHRNIIVASTVGYCASYMLLWWAQGAFPADSTFAFRLALVSLSYGLSNFFTSGMYPLLDHCMFVHLSRDARFTKELFGRQRLFGTLGQSFITALMGFTISIYGFDSIFVALAISTALFLFLVLWGLPSKRHTAPPTIIQEKTDRKVDDSPADIPSENHQTIFSPTKLLLSKPDYVFFLFIILIAGTTRGVIGNYVPQFMGTTLGVPTKYMGLILQSRILTEVVIFFIGKQMMERVGVVWMMIIGQAAGFLRAFAYAVVPAEHPWNLSPLLIELLKGVNNACLISAGVRYCHDVAPPGASTTAQGFFSGVHSFLANATSGFFGGAILQLFHRHQHGYRILFAATAILSFIGLALYCLRQLVNCKLSHRSSNES